MLDDTKRAVFVELMKSRGRQVTRDSAAALNLVDFAFKDSVPVRNAWSNLYSAYTFGDGASSDQGRLMRELLNAIAADLGLETDIRPADFERYYYPNALADEDHARALQVAKFLKVDNNIID